MSVEAMQSMLSKLQVKADVKVEEKTIKSKVPEIKKTRRIENPVMIDDGQGGKILGSYDIYETASTVGYKDADEVIQVAQINTDQPVNFTKVNSGTIAPSVTSGGKGKGGGGKGGGGGGGSKPKPAQPTKKS